MFSVARNLKLDNARQIYAAYSLLLTIATILRGFWSAPAARWQADFWFIRDIDNLLSGDLDQVVWFTWGNGQATNGYRWFSYLSSVFFNFDPRVETILYGMVLFALAMILGSFVLETKTQPLLRVFLYSLIIPTILFSLIGSYPRGMELGTFTGLTILVGFIRFVTSSRQMTNVALVLITAVVGLLLFFIFMGGYALGLTFSLVALTVLGRITGKKINRKIETVSAIYLIVSCLFAVSLRLASSTEEVSALSKLALQQESNFFFIPTFLLAGPSSGLLTSQTIEGLNKNISITLVMALSTLILIYASYLISKVFKSNDYGKYLGPLAIFAYGLGTGFMLLLFRPNDQLQLLNSWYSLHFKVMLCSVVILAIMVKSEKTSPALVREGIVQTASLLIFAIVMTSSWVQFNRQYSERQYFLNVAAVELYPALLDSQSEMTPLILPYAESIEAISILRKHRLSPYSVEEELKKSLGGDEGILLGGSSYGDGWVGMKSKLISINKSCPNLKLKIQVPDFIRNQTLTLTSDSKTRVLTAEDLIQDVNFGKVKEGGVIGLEFSIEKIPAELGINADQRALSARVEGKCN
jgi:hypothetical protein